MNYKIVSQNKKLTQKAILTFNLLNMKETKHIQQVDFWLVDVKTITNQALKSYQNQMKYTSILFITNSDEEIKFCLQNNFTNYIKSDFSKEELKYWCGYFKSMKKTKMLYKIRDYTFDVEKSILKSSEEVISLTKKEQELLKILLNNEYVQTKTIADKLKVESSTSVRTNINRIRRKVSENIIFQKRGLGYKLDYQKYRVKEEKYESYIKDLEEQNILMQSIVDKSSIFIVTFLHKQLYCINEAFRNYLGKEIVKELWEKEKGDFFLLFETNNKKEEFRDKLFSIGEYEVKFLPFNSNQDLDFKVKTYYFQHLDKHLLFFKN